MLEADLRRYISEEVKRQVNVILSGQAGTNTQFNETINNLFPGMPGITNRPVMHPYGYVSRAPENTISVTARQGDHPGNRLVLGHRDANRPEIEAGESAVYNVKGYEVRLKGASIVLGKGGTFETMVVGETLVELLQMMLDTLIAHTHVTSAPGSPTSPPIQASEFTEQMQNFITNEKILAKDGGRF